LIRDGATPARSGKEIAETLKVITSQQILKSQTQCSIRLPLEILSDEECTIYDLLSDTPIGVDELSEKSGFTIGLLLSILLNLELKGLIKQISGQLFVRN
jgi:DNA processing protein